MVVLSRRSASAAGSLKRSWSSSLTGGEPLAATVAKLGSDEGTGGGGSSCMLTLLAAELSWTRDAGGGCAAASGCCASISLSLWCRGAVEAVTFVAGTKV